MTSPSYLIASENHNLLNATEESWTDVVMNAPKTLALGLGAGVTEILNVPITVGNWLPGNDIPRIEYSKILQDYDSDLSKYYTDHKLGIDTIGFIAGSIVPGMAGVKVLRAGQTMLRGAGEGAFGTTLGRGLGLLAPEHTVALETAMSSIRSTGNVFKLGEANTLRALATGTGQQALEAAAFETVVAATMYKSPILDEMSIGDLTWNVAIGTALGGVIGGVFTGIGSAYKISGARNAAERELQYLSTGDVPASTSLPSSKLLFRLNRINDLDEAVLPETGDLVARAVSTRDASRKSLLLEVRNDLGTLANGDSDIANVLFQLVKVNPLDANVRHYIDSVAAGRMNMPSAIETELKKLKRLNADVSKVMTPEQEILFADNQVTYLKTYGENANAVFTDTPAVLSVTDKMKTGETISLTKTGVQIGKQHMTMDNNPHMPFNIFGVSHRIAEARMWWAEKLAKWVDDRIVPHQVHSTDIPLIEKAYRDGLERLSVIPESGAIKDAVTIHGRDQIYEFMVAQKKYVYERLQTDPKGSISISDFVDKFKSLLGINFNLTEEINPAHPYYGFFRRVTAKSDKMDVKADVIALDKLANITRPFTQVMHTLMHEQGHAIHRALLDAGGKTAANLRSMESLLNHEMMAIGMKQRAWYYGNDRALKQFGQDTVTSELIADTFSVMARTPGMIDKPQYAAIKQAFGHLIKPLPQEVLDAVAQRASKVSPEEAAKIANIETRWADGSGVRPNGEFARTAAREDYKTRMLEAGIREADLVDDILMLPSYVKMTTKTNHVQVDGNEVTGMAKVMAQTKLYDTESVNRASGILGTVMPVIPDKDWLIALTSKLVSFADNNYGSAGAAAQRAGLVTHNLIKAEKDFTSELFTPILQKVANNLDDAIGWSVLNEKMRNLPQRYTLSADGTALIYAREPVEAAFGGDVKAFQKALAAYADTMAEASNAGIATSVPIPEGIRELIANHISRNGTRSVNRAIIRNGEGLSDNFDPLAFYPIPRNPKDTPHFAFVVDNTITGNGHSKMIYAADGEKLQTMINEISGKMPDLNIYTKGEAEAYFKVHGQFEFERTLNENHINNRMARAGVSSSFLPLTDPSKIVNNFLEWHLARDAAGVRAAVTHNYSRQFESATANASATINAATSKFGYSGALATLESAADNPATNIIKTVLDIQKTSEYPYWSGLNNLVDKVFSNAWSKARAVLTDATDPAHLQAVNDSLTRSGVGGINGLVVNDALYRAMNATIPRGALTSFVNKANGLLATFALRMDVLNAINNTIGSNVLLGTEVKSVFDAIQRGDKNAVGELAQLVNTRIPGIDSAIQSPTKAVIAGMKAALDPANRAWAKQHGFSSSIRDQYDQTLDLLAISAGDTVASLDKKMSSALATAKKIGDTGEMLTGNTIAEEFNRTTAAFTMKQYTDIAVRYGIMDENAALTYINTFVNRTQGNFLASQRPLMFQGPIGQAMGLFQTYQFNLLQQVTRHIGEGQSKNALLMMGLQGTIYGANGLPGFAAVNTHIIGNAPGNTEHGDLYKAMYSGVGKETGDWLMYGFGSNWMSIFSADLKNNLYSRGDINPRNISILPANPADYPIVQATSKMLANIWESSQKVKMGADVWSTFLRGVEQNGVSRPLAGMAQVMGGITSATGEVTSVSSKGNILMAHDVNNLASLTRIVGGKPLDEAITNDTMFRFTSYMAKDAAKKATLGEAIKISILGGAPPDQDQINEFAASYAKSGGNQKEFSQFMMRQYKNATISQANQLTAVLGNPKSEAYQVMMGGMKLNDLSGKSELGKAE